MMKKKYYLIFILLLTGSMWQAFAQFPSPYCDADFSNCSFESIENVTFAGIDNTTGCNSGINDYTSQVATVAPGDTEEISVTIEADFNEYVYVFIDWDQNDTFDDPDEYYEVADATSSAGPHTLDIDVPIDAEPGETRMRVMLDYGNDTPDPCNESTYGEVEDYTVDVDTPIFPYCVANFSNCSWENIENVTFAGIDNSTGCNDGYNDYTNQIGTVFREDTEEISVTIEPDADEYIYAFIDWNQNEVFDDPDEYYEIATATSSAGPHTLNIDIPQDAELGETRMRVILSYNTSTPDPCSTNESFGEVEDYTIDVYASPEPYCLAFFTSCSFESIENVTFAGIDNSTGCNRGYNNYTDQVATVTREETEEISVTIEADMDEYIYAFIDWNQNEVFDDPDEYYEIATATSSAGPHTLNIDIPEDAELGETRMRVMVDYNTSTPDPCSGIGTSYGEVEDYNVEVLPAPCDAPTDISSSAVTDVSATITWTASPTETDGYNWAVYATGADPQTATPISEGTVSSGETEGNATGLDPETMYDAYVQTVCSSETSDWEGPETFETEETLGLGDSNVAGFSFFPNPAENVLNISATNAIETVAVYNMLGQKVLHTKVGSKSTTLQVSGLSSGAYFMKVSTGEEEGAYRFLKK